jgi:hypothetical protein
MIDSEKAADREAARGPLAGMGNFLALMADNFPGNIQSYATAPNGPPRLFDTLKLRHKAAIGFRNHSFCATMAESKSVSRSGLSCRHPFSQYGPRRRFLGLVRRPLARWAIVLSGVEPLEPALTRVGNVAPGRSRSL